MRSAREFVEELNLLKTETKDVWKEEVIDIVRARDKEYEENIREFLTRCLKASFKSRHHTGNLIKLQVINPLLNEIFGMEKKK